MCNGLASAPAIWQRFMEGILAGIEGVEVVIDDIVISAPTDEEHLKRLDTVLQRLDSNNIRLNLSKCMFFAEEIQFCGFRLRHQEIHKCDDKVSAFKNAPIPRAFKGDGSQKFEWTSEMHRAFEAVKSEMCSPRVLVPFDPTKALLLATDASSYGISAVLSNRYDDTTERPIAYYSRTLTETEKRYTQLEKEALGIKEGISRFFYYLFGRRFTLITDSKPLVSILSPSKSLPPLAAMRMTHYSMFLQSFNYDIVYRNTRDHGNADMLSRLPSKSEDFAASREAYDVLLVELANEAPLDIFQIAKRTRECEILRPLLSWLQGSNAMPRKRWRVDFSEFSVVNGTIFRGHRVVVPSACRDDVLQMLHDGHSGSDKMKELARRYVWWETLNADIEQLVRQCTACAEHARMPPKSYHSWEPSECAFDRVHCDYAGPIDGKYLFLLVDSHSKWLEVLASTTKTTKTTLKHLREVIARFGLPKVIVTDNDPTFASEDFNKFCTSNGIRHVTSPPFHPASNGQIERYVQTTKQALKKLKTGGETDLHTALQRFLFQHRMVPNSTTRRTPAEAMIGRQLRSRFDLLRELPRPPFIPDEPADFKPGDRVMVRSYNSHRKWMPGEVVRLCGRKVALVDSGGRTTKRQFNQLIRRKASRGTSRSSMDITVRDTLHPALLVGEDSFVVHNPIPDSMLLAQDGDVQAEQALFEDAVESFEASQDEVQSPAPQEETPVEDVQEEDAVTVRRSDRPNKAVPPIRFRS